MASKVGWLAPDGTFIECGVWEHWVLPDRLNVTENDLEMRGYVKIIDVGIKPEYLAPRFHLTEKQRKYLFDNGFDVEE